MIIAKLIGELKSDMELGRLTLENLSSEERDDLKKEIVSIRSTLEPMNILLKTLDHYTETRRDIHEVILGGGSMSIPRDEHVSLALEQSKDIVELINFIEMDKGGVSTPMMNLISSATIADHVDNFILYLRSLRG